jgi:hypothetical protein
VFSLEPAQSVVELSVFVVILNRKETSQMMQSGGIHARDRGNKNLVRKEPNLRAASSVFNGWHALQAFGREEFLIEMLIELSLVDGQHRAGFFLYGLHLDMARAPDAGNFFER